MDEIGLPILGTPADAIDEAEDRERFDELLERCNIPRAPGRTVFNLEEALAAADEIGLPVLMRPSYEMCIRDRPHLQGGQAASGASGQPQDQAGSQADPVNAQAC